MNNNDGRLDIPELIEDQVLDGDDGSSVSSEEELIARVRPGQGSEEDQEMSADEDWTEQETMLVKCFFCQETLDSRLKFFCHLQNSHEFSLTATIRKHNLDDFGYIRFVNFLRRVQPSVEVLVGEKPDRWASDEFMKPVLEEDEALLWDVADILTSEETEVLNREDGTVVSDPVQDVEYWQAKNAEAQALLMERNLALQKALEDLKQMKLTVATVLGDPSATVEPEEKEKGCARDDSYFTSYSHFGIHHEMLSDRVRTTSYRDAILLNADTLKGKTVLDVGCGTSILSMFAAKAGASKVIGVDMSDVIYNAMGILRENNLENQVKLVRGKVEEVDLGTPTVDIIVSEWMGYFLLFEGMLDSVLVARDKYLAPGGRLMPNRCTMSLVGVSDLEKYKNTLEFWNDVYGFKMTSMVGEVIRDASIEIIPDDCVVTEPVEILDLDLEKCSVVDTNFTRHFQLVVSRDCELTAIGGYFDTFFELEKRVWFSTGPKAEPTHWKQTVFYLPKKISVLAGGKLHCTINCKRLTKDTRGLEVKLSVGDLKDMLYTVD